MKRYWIAVASKDHVAVGIKEGIMQICHGKMAPLKRISPGDGIIYYSPQKTFGIKSPYKKFTALGYVQEKEPYQYQMSCDFIPWRREVAYIPCQEVAIEPLLDKLSFIKNKKSWGFIFRYGLFTIPETDFLLIADQMGVKNEQENTINRKNNTLQNS